MAPTARALTAALLTLSTSPPSANAQELRGTYLGTHVCGREILKADLQDRVIVFTYWTTTHPGALGSIQLLSRLQESHDNSVLQVVASQLKAEDLDEVEDSWWQNGGSPEIAVFNMGQLGKSPQPTLPLVFIFDHHGKLTFQGSPYKMDEPLQRTLHANPGKLVSGRDYEHLFDEARLIGWQQRNMTRTLTTLKELVEDPDGGPAEKEEAAHLLARVQAWHEAGLARVEELEGRDPEACMAELERRSHLLKGHPFAEPYETRHRELKKDRDFQREIRSWRRMQKLLAKGHKMGAFRFADTEERRRARAAFSKAATGFMEKHPDSLATKELQRRLADR